MRRRNAQTNDRQLVSVPPLQTPRGLELIKSSAKLYANGAGAAKPAIQLTYPVRAASNNPAAERTLFSPAGKLSVPAIAMFCLLLFVLPGLALAAIVWCGTRMVDTAAPEVVAGGASSLSAQLAGSVVHGAKRCGPDRFQRYHRSQGEDGAHRRALAVDYSENSPFGKNTLDAVEHGYGAAPLLCDATAEGSHRLTAPNGSPSVRWH